MPRRRRVPEGGLPLGQGRKRRVPLDLDEDEYEYIAALANALGLTKQRLLRAMIKAFREVRGYCRPVCRVSIEIGEGKTVDMTLPFFLDQRDA